MIRLIITIKSIEVIFVYDPTYVKENKIMT